MGTKLFIAPIAISSLVLWAADNYQPLNVKPGLWEVTTTVSTSGQIPIYSDMLEQLTPEQRARLEQRMSAKNLTAIETDCVQRLFNSGTTLQGRLIREDRKSCQHTLVSSTRSKAEVRMNCVENDMKFESKLQFEAVDSENVKGQTQTTVTGGDRTMNSNSTLTAKWLGPACGTTK